jgi:hypothetical protein
MGFNSPRSAYHGVVLMSEKGTNILYKSSFGLPGTEEDEIALVVVTEKSNEELLHSVIMEYFDVTEDPGLNDLVDNVLLPMDIPMEIYRDEMITVIPC